MTGRDHYLEIVLRPLDRSSILDYLGPEAAGVADRLYIHDEVDSTNLWLRRQVAERHLLSGTVCVAEAQTAGRGQHGRSWVDTPGSNIVLSVAWRFRATLANLMGLSLAAGVAVVRALRDYGISNVGLKWPNDVVWQKKKLAGLLVESNAESSGATVAIVGVGINVYLAERESVRIEQPWVDLMHIVDEGVDRNSVIALLIRRLNEMLRTFATSGFEAFRREWERYHVFAGQSVCLRQGELTIKARVLGVDSDGALRVIDEEGHVRVFHWGEISVRLDA
ncbi:MAG: biotin--[acetyl-CoA-carboxylase] ligase [Acidiferrobacterales bacterium]